MKTKARKNATGMPLKLALVASQIDQDIIARRAGLTPWRLSRIANGHLLATEDQQKSLARVLHRERTELFPDSTSEAIAS